MRPLLRLCLLLVVACVGCQMVWPTTPAPRPMRMKPAVDPVPPQDDEDNDYNYTACTPIPHRED